MPHKSDEPEQTIAIDRISDIQMVGLMGARRFMILEIKTGMKKNNRQNFFEDCRRLGVSTQRSKKGVLRDLEIFMQDNGWEGEITTW